MKELLTKCKQLDEISLKDLFWEFYNRGNLQEAYLIIHWMIISKMNTDFFTNVEVDKLKYSIEIFPQ